MGEVDEFVTQHAYKEETFTILTSMWMVTL